MRNWYLLSHNPMGAQHLGAQLSQLDVEVFAPAYIELKHRTDRPSLRKKETQLFPGYLFLKFDPDVVHTSKITAIPGARYFVGFGCGPYVIDENLIDGLKQATLLRLDQALCCIECRNLPPELMLHLRLIVRLPRSQERQRVLHTLLEQQLMVAHLNHAPGLVYTALVS